MVALLGPAFVAAVAYVDPGNFATNFSTGAQFGYGLAWVVALANLMAMIIRVGHHRPQYFPIYVTFAGWRGRAVTG